MIEGRRDILCNVAAGYHVKRIWRKSRFLLVNWFNCCQLRCRKLSPHYMQPEAPWREGKCFHFPMSSGKLFQNHQEKLCSSKKEHCGHQRKGLWVLSCEKLPWNKPPALDSFDLEMQESMSPRIEIVTLHKLFFFSGVFQDYQPSALEK